MSPTTSAPPFDLSLGLEDTHVLITGGNGYLGRAVAAAFLAANARVTIVDLPSVPKVFPSSPSDPATQRLNFHPADISSPAAVDAAFTGAEARFGPVACCVALAGLDLSVLPQTASLADAEPDDWRRVWDVNVHGTFVTCRRWLRGVRATVERGEELRNVSVVIVGSVSGRFGEEGMAAYAAGKVSEASAERAVSPPLRSGGRPLTASRRRCSTACSRASRSTRRGSTHVRESTPWRRGRSTRSGSGRRSRSTGRGFGGGSARRRECYAVPGWGGGC